MFLSIFFWCILPLFHGLRWDSYMVQFCNLKLFWFYADVFILILSGAPKSISSPLVTLRTLCILHWWYLIWNLLPNAASSLFPTYESLNFQWMNLYFHLFTFFSNFLISCWCFFWIYFNDKRCTWMKDDLLWKLSEVSPFSHIIASILQFF